MLYQTETAESLSLLWHLQNLVFQFHRPYPTSRKSKLESKWAGFEIPSSEVGGSTLLTCRFLRPDRVGTHTVQIIPTAECSTAEICILLPVKPAAATSRLLEGPRHRLQRG